MPSDSTAKHTGSSTQRDVLAIGICQALTAAVGGVVVMIIYGAAFDLMALSVPATDSRASGQGANVVRITAISR